MYLKLKDLKIDDNLEVPDIPSMSAMPDEAYRSYIKDMGVFWVDHHDILREVTTERPLATTLEQFDIFVEELVKCRDRMQPKRS